MLQEIINLVSEDKTVARARVRETRLPHGGGSEFLAYVSVTRVCLWYFAALGARASERAMAIDDARGRRSHCMEAPCEHVPRSRVGNDLNLLRRGEIGVMYVCVDESRLSQHDNKIRLSLSLSLSDETRY